MLLYYKERCVLFCAVVFVFKGPFPIFEKKGVSLKIYLSILSSLKITHEYKKLLVKNKITICSPPYRVAWLSSLNSCSVSHRYQM